METQAGKLERPLWQGLFCGVGMLIACVTCAYLLRSDLLMATGFAVGALAGLMIVGVQLIYKAAPLSWGNQQYIKAPRWVELVYIGMSALMVLLLLLSF